MTAQEISSREFAIARKGYDVDEVRRFLVEVATEFGNRPPASFADIGHRVASVIETAEKAANDLLETATRNAAALRAEAEAAAAEQREQAARLVAEADEHARLVRATAEREAAEHADTLVRERSEAQEQLQFHRLESERLRTEAEQYADELDEKIAKALAGARAEADDIRRLAEREARQITADAKQTSRLHLDEVRERCDLMIDDAQRQSTELMATAEKRALARADAALRQSQQRLELMIAAEREVYERLNKACRDLEGLAPVDLTEPAPVVPSRLSAAAPSNGHDEQPQPV